MAVTAHNVRLKNGKLVPLRMPEKTDRKIEGLSKIEDAQSIFNWKIGKSSLFLAFKGLCDKTEGNIADDEYNRIFITGDTNYTWNKSKDEKVENVPVVYMKKQIDGNTIIHPLTKKPLPPLKAKLTTSNGMPSDMDNIRYTYFIQTWVDPYGYESGKSEASLNYDASSAKYLQGIDFIYSDGDEVTFQGLTDDEVPHNGGTVNNPTPGYKRRIYKIITGSESGAYKFIKEFDSDPWGPKTVKIKDEDAGETLPEIEPIPEDLKNMTYVPGGFYTGFSPSNPKTVMFSDVGIPTSWPIGFRYDVTDNIVGLAVSTNTVFVLTDGFPFVITGTAPESMTVTKLAGPAACVSKRSICLYKNAVCYASNVGICMIASSADQGTVVQNLTEKVFTKAQWQELNPSSCLMAQFDGALFCFFTLNDEKKTRKGLVIDLLESENAITTHDEESTCLCIDDATDDLFFVRSTNTREG